MADLARSVGPSTLGRGDVLTADLLPTDGFRRVRLELVMVERRPLAVMEAKAKHLRSVAKVEAAAGSESVELTVPAWVPDSHRGHHVAWSYEAHVIGDRSGPDRRQTFPIAIRGGGPIDVKGPGYTDARKGGPMAGLPGFGKNPELSGLGRVYDHSGRWFVAALFSAIGVSAIAMTPPSEIVVGLVLGGVFIAIALALVLSHVFRKRLPIDDIELHVPDTPIRLDEPIEVVFDSPPDPSVEVGLEALELYKSPRADSSRTEINVVAERFVPFSASTITIPPRAGDRSGYAGQLVSLHWVVSLRMIGTPEKKRESLTRRIPIVRIA